MEEKLTRQLKIRLKPKQMLYLLKKAEEQGSTASSVMREILIERINKRDV